jgi:hypothetical protein
MSISKNGTYTYIYIYIYILYINVPFLWWNKIPKLVFWVSRNFEHSNLDKMANIAPPWCCRPVGTMKIGVYDVAGELFVIDRKDLSWVGHICWCHSGVLYGFGHVICDMPATLVDVSSWHRSYMVVLSVFSCCICYCYSPVGGAARWRIVGWLMAPWEIMLCSWVFWFAELQRRDGHDALPLLLSNSTFHDFKLWCGSTWILRKSVF